MKQFSVECVECQIHVEGYSETEVKDLIEEHQGVEHPDEGPIRWEWIQ